MRILVFAASGDAAVDSSPRNIISRQKLLTLFTFGAIFHQGK